MVHDERMKSPQRAADRGRVTAAAVVAAVVLAVAGSAAGTAYDRPGTAVFAGTLSFAFAIAVSRWWAPSSPSRFPVTASAG